MQDDYTILKPTILTPEQKAKDQAIAINGVCVQVFISHTAKTFTDGLIINMASMLDGLITQKEEELVDEFLKTVDRSPDNIAKLEMLANTGAVELSSALEEKIRARITELRRHSPSAVIANPKEEKLDPISNEIS